MTLNLEISDKLTNAASATGLFVVYAKTGGKLQGFNNIREAVTNAREVNASFVASPEGRIVWCSWIEDLGRWA